MDPHGPLRHLDAVQRGCVLGYVSLLRERLGEGLARILLHGSAARGICGPGGCRTIRTLTCWC